MAWDSTPPTKQELGSSSSWDSTAPTSQELEQLKPNFLDALKSKTSTRGLFGTSIGAGSDWLQNIRMAAQAAREGGNALSEVGDNQSPNVFVNAAKRVPGTIADIGSNLVANAIEPESLILEGAKMAAPAVNAMGRFVGSGAEKLSGLSYKTPGVLADITENPSIPFKPGIQTANEAYKNTFDSSQVGESFKNLLDHKSVVENAMNLLKQGTLTPEEALMARQSLDSMPSVPNSNYYPLRQEFDAIAKTKFANADAGRAIASQAENVRNWWPVNKSGDPSIGKIVLGGLGVSASHANPYSAVSAIMSPAVQAGLASAIGAGKIAVSPFLANPAVSGIGLSAYLNRKNK